MYRSTLWFSRKLLSKAGLSAKIPPLMASVPIRTMTLGSGVAL